MNTYTYFDGTILVPVQVVRLKFTEKEDISLNPFQNLILEAIEGDCNVEQIAEATLLDKYVIETEITQLIAQKLLERRGEVIELSDLSQRLLLVSRCVQSLNEERKKVCINLMTGAIEEYSKEHLAREGGTDGLELRPRIRKQEIDGISIEENIDFFRTYLHTFDAMEPEQIDVVLSSVYVEFIDDGEEKFRVLTISQIPCLISEGENEKENSDASAFPFWVRGYMCQVEFSIRSAIPEMDDDILFRLPGLGGVGMLSEKGMKLAAVVEACQKGTSMTAYYDYTSKTLQFYEPQSDSGGYKADLEMPRPQELTMDDRRRFAESAHSYFNLPPELALKVTCTDSTYIVSGDLNKL